MCFRCDVHLHTMYVSLFCWYVTIRTCKSQQTPGRPRFCTGFIIVYNYFIREACCFLNDRFHMWSFVITKKLHSKKVIAILTPMGHYDGWSLLGDIWDYFRFIMCDLFCLFVKKKTWTPYCYNRAPKCLLLSNVSYALLSCNTIQSGNGLYCYGGQFYGFLFPHSCYFYLYLYTFLCIGKG